MSRVNHQGNQGFWGAILYIGGQNFPFVGSCAWAQQIEVCCSVSRAVENQSKVYSIDEWFLIFCLRTGFQTSWYLFVNTHWCTCMAIWDHFFPNCKQWIFFAIFVVLPGFNQRHPKDAIETVPWRAFPGCNHLWTQVRTRVSQTHIPSLATGQWKLFPATTL